MGCPHVYSTWLQIAYSHDPLLRFHNLLERLTELRKTVHSLLLDYYKGYNSGTAN